LGAIPTVLSRRMRFSGVLLRSRGLLGLWHARTMLGSGGHAVMLSKNIKKNLLTTPV
jgi:hypothetical protein